MMDFGFYESLVSSNVSSSVIFFEIENPLDVSLRLDIAKSRGVWVWVWVWETQILAAFAEFLSPDADERSAKR